MGYYMHQMDAVFTIRKEHFDAALAAIKAERHGSWVSEEKVQGAKSLSEAMYAWRWEVFIDDTGDIANISFNGQKSGDEDTLFTAIAPFVKEDSYIEMQGEEGSLWRWWFTDGQCVEIYPSIIWPDMDK